MLQHPFLPVIAVALLCSSLPARAQEAQPDFPDGPGKEIFVATCGGCHDINRARAGYTATGWNTLQAMMENMGAPVAPEDWPKLTTYLINSFPEKARPPAAIVAGPVEAKIRLWDVPTR